jgi:hypothetical protein
MGEMKYLNKKKGRDHLGNLDVDGRIILRWILIGCEDVD